jgi:hypothetical protein
MKGILHKRIALLFVAILFILALIPAYYPPEDEALRNDGPFSRAYGLLFAAVCPVYFFDHNLCWVETSSPHKKIGILPKAHSSSSETRAPPA